MKRRLMQLSTKSAMSDASPFCFGYFLTEIVCETPHSFTESVVDSSPLVNFQVKLR